MEAFVCCSLCLQTLPDEVELIAQCFKAIRHPDLSHIGFTDVVALRTFFEVIVTQEVDFLLEQKQRMMNVIDISLCVDASQNRMT